jgi:hypothetical protein
MMYTTYSLRKGRWQGGKRKREKNIIEQMLTTGKLEHMWGFFVSYVFETGSHNEAQAELELTILLP